MKNSILKPQVKIGQKYHILGPVWNIRENDQKSVIFYDFFKLLLSVLRWYCRYGEMFLRPLEGVLGPRIQF